MHLMRCLALLKAKFLFLFATYISGVNDLADALSRDNFLSPHPQAQLSPAPLPPELLDLTIIKKPELDIPSLDRLVESYFRSGLAPSTRHSYTSAKRRFLSFCDVSKSTPLPVTEQLLCRYVSFLAEQGLSSKSIKLYLSAVCHLQISINLQDP